MNPRPGFDLHPGAAQDIPEIWEFIAEDSPHAAQRMREEMLEAIGKLVAFPHEGHKRDDLTKRPLRFWRVRDFLVAYVRDAKPLPVIAVLHDRRNPRTISAILNKRQ